VLLSATTAVMEKIAVPAEAVADSEMPSPSTWNVTVGLPPGSGESVTFIVVALVLDSKILVGLQLKFYPRMVLLCLVYHVSCHTRNPSPQPSLQQP
jgi:hypothetical protein